MKAENDPRFGYNEPEELDGEERFEEWEPGADHHAEYADPAYEDPFRDDAPMTREQAEALIADAAEAYAAIETIKQNAETLIKRQQAIITVIEQDERLREWVAANLDKGRRSVTTLQGVAGLRTRSARVAVTDEKKALEWAREVYPAAVTEKLDRSALKATKDGELLLVPTGELLEGVPGVEVVPANEVFYVKPVSRKKAVAESEEEE